MRILAEMFTIVVGALAIAKYTIDFVMRKRARRAISNVEHVRKLQEENKEIDEALENIKGKPAERRK